MIHLSARLSIVVAMLLVAASVVPPVVAQAKSVEVPRRDADIAIRQDGDVQIVETWEMKFSGGPFRSASYRVELDRAKEIAAWSVAEAERDYRVADTKLEEEPHTFNYSQNTLIWYYLARHDQTCIFTLRFTLKGALRTTDGSDEFFRKFTTPYPTRSVHVVMHLPGKFSAQDVWFLAVHDGANEPFRAQLIDGQTIEFTDDFYSSRADWTIQTRFPHGALTAVTAPPVVEQDDRNSPASWAMGIILIAIMILFIVDGFYGFRVSRVVFKILSLFLPPD